MSKRNKYSLKTKLIHSYFKSRLVYKTKRKRKKINNYSADSLVINTEMWQNYNLALRDEFRVLARKGEREKKC